MFYNNGAHSIAENGVNKAEVKLSKLQKSIKQYFIFTENELKLFEDNVDEIVNQGRSGFLKELTMDQTQLRQKYFFGERYTYGNQTTSGLGVEKLYPKNSVDPIPNWIISCIINPLTAAKILPENFVNSVVINDYKERGCIVSHIDPPQIFDRPIVSLSLFSDSALCFGCKFKYKPIRCSPPLLKLDMPRGITTYLSGFAANEITHCVRPQDVTQRRAVIMLRRVHPFAPRLTIECNAAGHTRKKYVNINNGHNVKLSVEYFMKCYLNLQKYWKYHTKYGRIYKKCNKRKSNFHSTRYNIGTHVMI